MKYSVWNTLFKTAIFSFLLGYAAPEATAQIADINTFCQRYSENSRCDDVVAINPEVTDVAAAPSQIIKVEFDTAGSDKESILIELREETLGDITLSAFHVEETEGPLYRASNGAVGALVPVPLPFDLLELYDTNTSETNFLAFTPDSCASEPSLVDSQTTDVANCAIIGTDSISFSEDVDIRAGAFTLRYTEGSLTRAVTFRIGDHDASFVNEIETDNLCENFPLNSRCRYWPISQTDSVAE
ncbi:MAG: hypothetical protein AAF703_07820 [Cyanobacteria bacterium P01_D01_bin.105]